MSEERGTLEAIAEHLAIALRPLKDAVADADSFRAFLARLGWSAQSLPAQWSALATHVDELITALEALREARSLETALATFDKVSALYQALVAIDTAPAGVDASAFLAEIGGRIFELLLVDYLTIAHPTFATFFRATGVITEVPQEESATRPPHVETRFRFDELAKVATDPASIPERIYGWGTPDLAFELIAEQLHEVATAIGLLTRYGPADPVLAAGLQAPPDQTEHAIRSQLSIVLVEPVIAGRPVDIGLALLELPPESGRPAGIILQPHIPSTIAEEHEITPTLKFRLRAGSDIARTFGILLRPDGIDIRYPFEPGTAPPTAGFGAGLDHKPAAPTLLFGSPGTTRLEYQGASLDFGFTAVGTEIDVMLGARLEALTLVLAAGEGDSFLHHILGEGESRVAIPLGVEWSRRHGARFIGSGAFEVVVYPHQRLGPISIEEVAIRLLIPAQRPPDLRLELGVGITGELGPLAFFVQGIGLRFDAKFSPGNAGPFDLRLGYKPPTGMGLSIAAGGFKGGGFLVHDASKGEYAGGLELEFQGLLTLKAVGILNTIMPDQSRGFSLLVIISGEFPPIQLGFGFTLLGVGGLLGLNRTVALDVLQAGFRDGSVGSVLFPRDVVANAPRIINDLRRFFPPLRGGFLIGPMAKFGWGTPTLISLELGIVLEIGRPSFAILGILRLTLPTADAPIIDLKVNFVGIVDAEKGQISFDGALFDSNLLTFTLTGDLAVRLYWKENANLLLAVGGFHPAYTPPPMGLGPMQRITLIIFEGNPNLRAEIYVALTANTIQLGAKVELYAGTGVFNVYGFLALDVVVDPLPLHFVALVTGMLAVRTGSSTLFSVRLELMLEGPTPWHAVGKASFEIGFIFTVTISIRFNVTIGIPWITALLPVDVLLRLIDALGLPGNWRTLLPPAFRMQVSLRELPPASEALILHPFGALEVSQKVVPLNLEISRFGTLEPQNGKAFRIAGARLGTSEETLAGVKEQFAPAQFIEMSDADKLSRQSFERYDSGITLGGSDEPETDYAASLEIVYEVIYVPERQRPTRFHLADHFFGALLGSSAVAKSPLASGKRAPSPLGTPKVELRGNTFGLATTRDLALHSETPVFESEAEAHIALHRLAATDPVLARGLQVVPIFELDAA